MSLYRAVSKYEKEDYEKYNRFRTSHNTLEGKQFFKSEAAIQSFVNSARKSKYDPPYQFFFAINIDEECLNGLEFDNRVLDGFDAITISKSSLTSFNKCINFVTDHAF